MKYYAVLGSQYGDEGKGKLLDWLMTNGDVCIRFNGGSNAGHTIVVNDIKYHTHVLPSGLIHNHTLNIMGNGMVIGIDNLLNEIKDLKSKGVDIINRLLISDRAHVVLSVHKELDTINGGSIGTTKQGIGPSYSSKSNRTGFRVCDLVSEKWMEKLEKCYKNYVYYFDETKLKTLMENDIKLINESMEIFKQSVVNVVDYLYKYSLCKENLNKTIVFEGANAVMLDIDHGTYPFVTSSSCTTAGVFTGSGINSTDFYKNDYEIIGVMKAYITRVGNGKLITESEDEGKIMQKVGGEIGVTTGRMRRCGWLDLVQMRYSININGYTHLNITKMDVLSEFDKIYIANSYRHSITNENVDTYPADENDLHYLEPIYTQLDGWKGYDISTAKTYDDLHPNVKNYIKIIESHLRVPIKYINTGQERLQMIIKE